MPESLPLPPHATMSKARPVTDPMRRNMMIPLLWLPLRTIYHTKRFGVREHCVKVGEVSRKIHGRGPVSS